MATSRYAPDTGRLTSATDNRTGSSATGSSNTNQSSDQIQNTSQTTNSNQTQTTDQTTRNFTSQQEAALNALIAQLTAGGTPEMRRQAAQRQGVIDQSRETQAAYSKPAAFADAAGAMQQQLRRTMEALLPTISRAAEDAGSSGGALRALLLQDVANKAAESSSALGLNAAAQYGNINANFAQVLESLTRSDPAAAQMLVQALGVAKGGTQTTTGTVNTSGTQTMNGTVNTSGRQQTTQNTQENKQGYTDFAPFAVDTTPQFFGAMDTPVQSFAGSSRHNREQLAGLLDNNAWSSYEF